MTTESHQLVNGIIDGDNHWRDELIKKIEKVKSDNFPSDVQVLPIHTITLKLRLGGQISSNNRRLQTE